MMRPGLDLGPVDRLPMLWRLRALRCRWWLESREGPGLDVEQHGENIATADVFALPAIPSLEDRRAA